MIHEYPSIYIDDFRGSLDRPPPELCFLTHMHEDHTAGLQRKSYNGPAIYCSEATKQMLLNFHTNFGKGVKKYDHLGQKGLVKALEIDKPYHFPYNGESIQVTFIEVNHCPGSVMILIQPKNPGKAVLFTGDIRCELTELNILRRTPTLYPYLKEFASANPLTLYVDSTYTQHEEPEKGYLPNMTGIQRLIELLKLYPPHIQFCIADMCTGHEQVLIELSRSLQTRVHMDAYLYNYYQKVAPYSPLASQLLSYACTSGVVENVSLRSKIAPIEEMKTNKTITPNRIHLCHRNNGCSVRHVDSPTVYFKACNQPTTEMVDLQNKFFKIKEIGSMELMNGNIYKGPTQRYYLHQGTYYPLFPFYYYSRHASYPELCEFRDLFNVVNIRGLDGADIMESKTQHIGLSKIFHSSVEASSSDDELERFQAFCFIGNPNIQNPSISSAHSSMSSHETLEMLHSDNANEMVNTQNPDDAVGIVEETPEDMYVRMNKQPFPWAAQLLTSHDNDQLFRNPSEIIFVDETQNKILSFEYQLRDNPNLWFSFCFDYSNNS